MKLELEIEYPHQKRVRNALKELQHGRPIQWNEREIWRGCGTMESVFTIEANEEDMLAVERRLGYRVPVYELNQIAERAWGGNGRCLG